MIHVIRDRATPQQIQDMLQELQTYIKMAIDIRRRILAGGGAMHADCEAVLLEDGSEQADLWGSGWWPDSGNIRYESLINIRPNRGNRSMLIQDAGIRAMIESIVRERLG